MPCIFIGFAEGYKGWKVYNPVIKKVLVARDIVFQEDVFPGLSLKDQSQPHTPVGIAEIWPYNKPVNPKPHETEPIDNGNNDKDSDNEDQDDFDNPKDDNEGDDSDDKPSTATTPHKPPSTLPDNKPGRQHKQRSFAPQKLPESPTPETHGSKREHNETSDNEDGHIPCPDFGPAPPPPSCIPVRLPSTPVDTEEPKPTAKSRAQKPLLQPSTSTRPIRSGVVQDYYKVMGIKRRGTTPTPRRQQRVDEEDEEDQGGVGGDDGKDLANDKEPVDTETVDVYDIELGEVIPFEHGLQMALMMAVEKHQTALGAATRPEDAPRTWNEAMSGPNKHLWLEACQKEMDAHEENGTWKLVPLPDGRKVGYSQMPGVDFDQTFSPTACLAALRVIFAKICANGEYLESIDISNAYLNGKFEDKYEVYMWQPQGYEEKGPNGEKWVCRLKKGLYGLKQSGRLWNQRLPVKLECLGFTQIKSNPAVYIWETEGIRIICPVFVDDITLTSKSKEKIQ
ncbi:hypothetical protein MD484_g9021, partial [Candolleomyces efflorescens]